MGKVINNKNFWLAVVVVIAAAGFTISNQDTPGAGLSTTVYETAGIDRGDIIRSIAATGRVQAHVTVEVGSQLSGKIEELLVDFNDVVSIGQVVAKIDSQTYEQRVLQASADLESSKATLLVRQASVMRAEAVLLHAKRDFDRVTSLLKTSVVAEADLDMTRSNHDSAKAGLQIAHAEVISARAGIRQREASLASAEIDLGRTQITSPIDGVVIERNVDKGQTVAASLSAPILFKIAQNLKQIQIEASVDESDIGRVRKNNSVTFKVDAYEDKDFTGVVEQVRLSPLELNNVVTYSVIINASNNDLSLLPGMTANIEIRTGERKDVLRIPNSALRVRATVEMRGMVEALAESPNSAQRGGGGRGRGGARGGGQFDRVFAELKLTEDTQDKIQSERRSVMSSIRSQMTAGGDRSQFAQLMSSKIPAIFKKHLTAEQYAQYQAISDNREEVRRGTAWIKDEEGNVRPQSVRLGIADSAFTEVLGGGLQEGADVVTRVRQMTN